jgi:hypothetical protein
MDCDKIYVINLDKRRDKKILIELKLKSVNITNYEIYTAQDGQDPVYSSLFKICNNINQSDTIGQTSISSLGALGLVVTYTKLLERMYINQYQKVMILEDDICFHKDFINLASKVTYTLKKSNDHPDIVWLGCSHTIPSSRQISQADHSGLYNLDSLDIVYGTYGLILTRSAIIKLLKVINKRSILKLSPIDNILNILQRSKIVSGAIAYPELMIPDVTDSDIINERNQIKYCMDRYISLDNYLYISQQLLSRLKVRMSNLKQMDPDNFESAVSDLIKNRSTDPDVTKLIKFIKSITSPGNNMPINIVAKIIMTLI